MWKITKCCFFAAVLFTFASCDKKVSKKTEVPNRTDSASKQEVNNAALVEQVEYEKYTGAWFTVEFPGNFSVTPSLQSATRTEGYDSVVFTSPDGKVQFYIFSPQWSGVATDIALQSGEEETEHTTDTENGLIVERWTIRADNGQYSRSYESTSETGGINKIFGIRYLSSEDLERYRAEYLHFKNSLQQYAD
ncbi:hypothetical protein J8J42_01925 [Chryseobacterium sp. cx-311]|uniref:hypothetical protein n=1 Tax=Marnyiella aurantia TaxID=2758037 RepID=UPI001AE88CBC|nr:hypothetical protein [Marnyiella aurantia]MBP0611801.1 hypothetical protein [Marnyiella aurantia]